MVSSVWWKRSKVIAVAGMDRGKMQSGRSVARFSGASGRHSRYHRDRSVRLQLS